MKQPDYVVKQKNLWNQLSLPTPCRHLYMGTGSITKVEVSKDNTDLILMCSFGSQKVGFLYSEIQKTKTHPLQFSASQSKLYSQLLATLSTAIVTHKTATNAEIENFNSVASVVATEPIVDLPQPTKKSKSKKSNVEPVESEELSQEVFELASVEVSPCSDNTVQEAVKAVEVTEDYPAEAELIDSKVMLLDNTNADY